MTNFTNAVDLKKTIFYTHLSQWDNKAAQVFFLASKTDVICRHKHLAQNVHFVKWSPQSAICVPIKFFIFRKPKQSTVPFTLCSGIKIPKKSISVYYCTYASIFPQVICMYYTFAF